MTNNKEISKAQKKQKLIKSEINKIQKKIPVYIIAYLLVTILGIYFLEDPLYDFFGSSYNFILTISFICTFIFLVLIYRIILQITSKKKESKAIGTKIYRLMRLEKEKASLN